MKSRSVITAGLGVFLLFLLSGVGAAPIEFDASGGSLKANGKPFAIKALNWFGLETANNNLHGLWNKPLSFFVNFISTNKFNAVRIPFAADLALNDATATGTDGDPSLKGKSSLEVLDAAVSALAAKNVLVMLDMHRLTASAGITDLWYNGDVSEAELITAWKKMAARYCDNWNVFAADIKNEPHGAATWGTGNDATDWDAAAARIGNAVLSVCPRWLIFVEGVEKVDGVTGWWGGNLNAAAKYPVALSNKKRLVYSPHVYGPGVFMQTYFSDSKFPANMPDIWDKTLGSMATSTEQAIIPGEWGSFYTGKDKVWMDAFASWLAKTGNSPGFYWCLNPNSGDTGGLLEDDWTTPQTAKLELLAQFPSTDVGSLVGAAPAAAAAAAPATVVATAVPAPAPAATKVSGGAKCNVDYELVRSWPEGFQGEIKVTAGGATSGWTLTFNIPAGAKITQVWGGVVADGAGPAVEIKPTAHNAALAAGETETIGFVATRPKSSQLAQDPTAFALSGAGCA